MESKENLLSKISIPEDLRKLDPTDLLQVSEELRQFIIDVVCNNPGHFGASLGVVELTVALHYAFNTPYDKIIWDVGHQAYGHKILTGRREVFDTNRKYKGISGFPRMMESEYDSFGTGHSSTSISAALGMAQAADKLNENRHIVAVIGDGAMTAGQAFEGLNNAGISKADLLVILNDNNIAIDPNVGALKEYLIDITTSKTYNRFKDKVWNFLGKFGKLGPNARTLAAQLEAGFKSTILDRSNLFEGLNFRYFGPIDGHDVLHLVKILEDLKRIPGPKLLHCITVKGKGFKQAEEHQTTFHAPGIFDKKTGELIITATNGQAPLTYQEVFGITILELARLNDRITAITPAMPTGSSLSIMMNEMPDRTYDVGIAEQHAVTFSAGLATEGMIPYCHIYSSFIQRAYDQVIHDVALQNLHVIFCVDRGGLVGADGATHHGFFDMAFMRSIPNMTICAPMDEVELRNMLYTAQLEKNKFPFSIRYPRGRGVIIDWKRPFLEIGIGKSRLISDGDKLAILTIGTPGNVVASIVSRLSEKISIAHYDMRFVSPLDKDALHNIFSKFKHIITVEDGVLKGGFGSAVIEFMSDNGYNADVRRLGIPDYFVEHGTQDELHRECGYDAEGIECAIMEMAVKIEAEISKGKPANGLLRPSGLAMTDEV